MRICIIGAGAIGGLIGARLAARTDCQPAVLARGQTLRALRAHGWRADTAGEVLRAPARAFERAEDIGEQDLVILAVKGPALRDVAQGLAPLLGEHTMVMPAMNGVELAIAITQKYPATKILLISGQTGIADILADSRERGYEFPLLAKPAHPSKVVEALRRLKNE